MQELGDEIAGDWWSRRIFLSHDWYHVFYAHDGFVGSVFVAYSTT